MGIKLFIARGVGKIALAAQAHAPELLFAAGTVTFFATVVSACKGTYKFEEVLEEHNQTLENLKKAEEGVESGEIKVSYNKQQAMGDRIGRYINTAWGFIRAYKWALIFGATSLACFFWQGRILRKWLGGAIAALSVATAKNEALEGAIREKYGEEELNNLTHGTVTVGSEDGDGKLKEKEYVTGSYDRYSKFFDASTGNFEKDPESNRVFLQTKQNWANHKLHTRGYLFLNEVYEMLGIEPTQAGQIMGWRLYDNEEERIANGASNSVSFGIFNNSSEASRRFVNGLEDSILLEFNVDKTPILGKVGLAKA